MTIAEDARREELFDNSIVAHPFSGQVEAVTGKLSDVDPFWGDDDDFRYQSELPIVEEVDGETKEVKVRPVGAEFWGLDEGILLNETLQRETYDPLVVLLEIFDNQIDLMRKAQEKFNNGFSLRKLFGKEAKFSNEQKLLETLRGEIKVIQLIIASDDSDKHTLKEHLDNAKQKFSNFVNAKKHWVYVNKDEHADILFEASFGQPIVEGKDYFSIDPFLNSVKSLFEKVTATAIKFIPPIQDAYHPTINPWGDIENAIPEQTYPEVIVPTIIADKAIDSIPYIERRSVQEQIENVALLIVRAKRNTLFSPKRPIGKDQHSLNGLLDQNLSEFVETIDTALANGEDVAELRLLQRSMLMVAEGFSWASIQKNSCESIDSLLERFEEFKVLQQNYKNNPDANKVWTEAFNETEKVFKDATSPLRKLATPIVVEKESTVGKNRPSNPKTGPRNLQARVEAVARKRAAIEFAEPLTIVEAPAIQAIAITE